MSTFMANNANIERKWYILDAAGKPLGKNSLKRLHIYADANYEQQAQKPVELDV